MMGNQKSEWAPSSREEKPKFTYSLGAQILVLGWTIAFLLGVYAYVSLSGMENILDFAWLGLIELVLLYGMILRLRLRLRAAWFYEDHAILKTRGAKEDVQYSEMREVSLTQSKWTGTKLMIFLRTSEKPLILIKNPSTKSGPNLYTWLKARTSRKG